MAKIGRPNGLIRYASHRGILEGVKLRPTPRTIGYTTVLTVLLVLFVILLTGRSDIETSILRTPGVMYQELDNGMIRNLYSFKVINKTFEPMPITLKLKNASGTITMVAGDIFLESQGLAEQAFFVDRPVVDLHTSHDEITIQVWAGETLKEEVETKFLGPRIDRHEDDRKMNDDD